MSYSRLVFHSQHNFYHMSCGPQEDAGNQATFPGDDHKKFEKILHFRSPGNDLTYFWLVVMKM